MLMNIYNYLVQKVQVTQPDTHTLSLLGQFSFPAESPTTLSSLPSFNTHPQEEIASPFPVSTSGNPTHLSRSSSKAHFSLKSAPPPSGS